MPPLNPQDWFTRLLTQGLLHLLLLVVDSLFGLLTRVEFFYRTDPAATIDHPAAAALHAAMLGVAGALLGCLALGGVYSVMVRGVGLGGLTPGQLLGRLIAVSAALATCRAWAGWLIELNNAVCRLVGADRLGAAASGPAALARLLGLDPARERTFFEALGAVGTATSKALLTAYFDDGGPAATLLAALLLLLLAVLVALLALQLLLRQLLVAGLFAVAPVFLALGVLPATSGLAAAWLRWFVPVVFLQAVQVTILAQGHEWLRRGAGDATAGPGAAIVPLLMAMAALLLTLRAPGLLAAGAAGLLDVAGPVAGAGQAGLRAVVAARRPRR
jgi:hypothetical protein